MWPRTIGPRLFQEASGATSKAAEPAARDVRGPRALAARADERFRPAHPLQIRAASLVVRELMHEIDQRGGKLHRMSSLSEDATRPVRQIRSRAERIG